MSGVIPWKPDQGYLLPYEYIVRIANFQFYWQVGVWWKLELGDIILLSISFNNNLKFLFTPQFGMWATCDSSASYVVPGSNQAVSLNCKCCPVISLFSIHCL